jgi:methionyl-tRNA formyltransferase
LAQLGAPLVLAAIDALEAGTAQPLVQDSALATKAPRLKKSDGLIDWSRSAAALRAQVRAFDPWPKSFTFRRREAGEPLRLIVEQVAVVPAQDGGAGVEPGMVVEASGERLLIACGQDVLEIQKVQPAGKRILTAGEFLRGYPLRPGERLG